MLEAHLLLAETPPLGFNRERGLLVGNGILKRVNDVGQIEGNGTIGMLRLVEGAIRTLTAIQFRPGRGLWEFPPAKRCDKRRSLVSGIIARQVSCPLFRAPPLSARLRKAEIRPELHPVRLL